MPIKVTVSPEVRRNQVQRNQRGKGATHQLSFYTDEAFATRVNQIAVANKRSVSALLSEIVEFAIDTLEQGDTELEESASGPLSYNDFPKEQQRSKPQVTLRMTVAPARHQTYAEIAAETLKRIPGPSDEFYTEAYRREANARNGYGLIRE